MLQNTVEIIVTASSFVQKNNSELEVNDTRSSKDERINCKSPKVSLRHQIKEFQLARDRDRRVTKL